MGTQKRNLGLDILKSVLAWLVILGHILQIQITNGNSEVSIWAIEYFIYSFHMPLFIAITGYLMYGKRIEVQAFIKKRSIQLLVPCLVWGLLIGIYDYYIGHDNLKQVVKDVILSDLWYLKSLYVILLVSLPFLLFRESIYKAIGVLIIFATSALFGGIFLMALQTPAFLFGYYLHAIEYKLEGKKLIRIIFFVISLLLFVSELAILRPDIDTNCLNILQYDSSAYYLNYANRMLLALSGIPVIFLAFKRVLWGGGVLSTIGRYSLGIYCVQSLITERLFASLFSHCSLIGCFIISIVQLTICILLCVLFEKNKFLKKTIGM